MEVIDPKVDHVTGHSGTTALTCLLVTMSGAPGLLLYRSSINAVVGATLRRRAAAEEKNVGSSTGTGSNSFFLGGLVFECVFIYLPVVLCQMRRPFAYYGTMICVL